MALLALGVGASACGSASSEGKEAGEGGAVKAGALSVEVLSTRYLDSGDKEDAAYLVGQPSVGLGSTWFGVFVRVKNEGKSPSRAPSLTITSAAGTRYSAFPTENPQALQFGEVIGPNEQRPKPGAPQQGPDEGALVIFRLDRAAAGNQPLTLQIEGFGSAPTGIKLDEL